MPRPTTLLSTLALLVLLASPVLAANTDPLFVSLTSDDDHRSLMAISFAQGQMERGHPVTLYLSDKGVLVASRTNAGRYAEQQKKLAELLSKGASVLLCPMCSKKYDVLVSDCVDGVRLSSPELTGKALFRKNTRTLSW